MEEIEGSILQNHQNEINDQSKEQEDDHINHHLDNVNEKESNGHIYPLYQMENNGDLTNAQLQSVEEQLILEAQDNQKQVSQIKQEVETQKQEKIEAKQVQLVEGNQQLAKKLDQPQLQQSELLEEQNSYKIRSNNWKKIDQAMQELSGQDKDFWKRVTQVKLGIQLTKSEHDKLVLFCEKKKILHQSLNISLVSNNDERIIECPSLKIEFLKFKIQTELENKKISYEIRGQELHLKNTFLNLKDFQQICDDFNNYKKDIKFISFKLEDKINNNSLNFILEDGSFFQTAFYQNLKKICQIEHSILYYDERIEGNRNSSVSQISETETDTQLVVNGKKLNRKSELVLFGYNQQKLDKFQIELNEYYSRVKEVIFPLEIKEDFKSSKIKVEKKLKEDIEQAIKLSFKDLFEDLFLKELLEDAKAKQLDMTFLNRSHLQIRIKLQGQKRSIEQFIQNVESIEDQFNSIVFFLPEFSDQFIEKTVYSRIQWYIEDLSKQKSSNKCRVFAPNLQNNYFHMIFLKKNEDQDIIKIASDLKRLTQLKRVKCQKIVMQDQLIEEFRSYKDKLCELVQERTTLFLIGTEEEIQKGKAIIDKHLEKNILKDYTFNFENELECKIFASFYKNDTNEQFPQFAFVQIQEKTLFYKLPLFYAENLHEFLEKKQIQIALEIQNVPQQCTEKQFETLQNGNLPVLKRIKEDLAVEVVTDQKKLSDLGFFNNLFKVNPSDYKKFKVLESSSNLTVTLIIGKPECIAMDQLLLMIYLNGKYFDNQTPYVMQVSNSGRFVVKDINKYNSLIGINESEEEIYEKRKKLKKIKEICLYQQTSVPSFPTNSINYSLVKSDQSNFYENIKKYLDDNAFSSNFGMIVPSDINLAENLIRFLKQILYDSKPNQETKSYRNLLLFCEEKQFLDTFRWLLDPSNKNEVQMMINHNRQSPIYRQQMEYSFLDPSIEFPQEVSRILNILDTNSKNKYKHFYAMLPPNNSEEELTQIKIILPTDKRQLVYIRNGEIFKPPSASNRSQDIYIDQMNSIIENAIKMKIDSLITYQNNSLEFRFQKVKVNFESCFIKYYYNNSNNNNNNNNNNSFNNKNNNDNENNNSKQLLYKAQLKAGQQNQLQYLLRGKATAIEEAEKLITDEIFGQDQRVLWDYKYVDEKNVAITNITNSQVEKEKQIFQAYKKKFEKDNLKLHSLKFIQNIPQAQNFQYSKNEIHKKWEEVPFVHQDLFFSASEEILQQIYGCLELGFDVRIHSGIGEQKLNEYCITLSNRLQKNFFKNKEKLQCLICEVIIGQKINLSQSLENVKRLPKEEQRGLFYDTLVEDDYDEMKVGIFDNKRIYPLYLAEYSILVDNIDYEGSHYCSSS